MVTFKSHAIPKSNHTVMISNFAKIGFRHQGCGDLLHPEQHKQLWLLQRYAHGYGFKLYRWIT